VSAAAANVVGFDPLRDKSYQQTRLGRSVADFLAWLETGGAAERTLDQYERDLARGCLMFPDKSIEDFEDADMLHVARSFQPKERRVRVAAYKSFFKWAVASRLRVSNPCDALPRIKPQPKKVFDLFAEPEITALCGLPVRDGALFALMFETGARKADCRHFRFRNWLPDATPDAPYGMLVFHEGKGGKDRQGPAREVVARKLSERALVEGLAPPDHLGYSRPGGGHSISRKTPIGDTSFNTWWVRCLAEAGVRYRNPHLTRHTFATNYLRGRGRLETLQLVLGHESIQTTADLYGHLDMRDVAVDMRLVSTESDRS